MAAFFVLTSSCLCLIVLGKKRCNCLLQDELDHGLFNAQLLAKARNSTRSATDHFGDFDVAVIRVVADELEVQSSHVPKRFVSWEAFP